MKKYFFTTILVLLISFPFMIYSSNGDKTAKLTTMDFHSTYGFLQNKGQITNENGKINNDVLFIYEDKGFKCQLRKNGFSYEIYHMEYQKTPTAMVDYKGLPEFARYRPEITFHSHRIDINFINSNPYPRVSYFGESEDYYNFYYPHTGNNGATGVRHYEQVTYTDIYPGIDIRFKIIENGIKYDIIIHPGANPEDIQMLYSGVDDMHLESKDMLFLNTSEGFVKEEIRASYIISDFSEVNSANEEFIDVSFQLENNIIKFDIENYNSNNTIVIDPVIVWGTYYGYVNQDCINAVNHDEMNNVIGAGYTASTSNIASSGAFQTTFGGGGYDAFLVKLDRSGKRTWATYCGGDSVDIAQGVAADNVWHYVYIMGYTSSRNGIASEDAYQEEHASGIYDAFIGKFNMNGQRIWCTYYGGNGVLSGGQIGGEYIFNAAIDERYQDIYFTGVTTSDENIATQGAHQDRWSGDFDAMLVKFNGDCEREWGTYYGGTEFDGAYGITLDPSGYITIGGHTESNNSDQFDEELIASEGAYQETRSGSSDAFVARFNLVGTRQWGTYFGGPAEEVIYCTAADKHKNVYIGGTTHSTSGIATTGTHQTDKNDGNDGFFAKFSPSGNRLWGSYYGGDRSDEIVSMYCDSEGNLAFTGHTTSNESIATEGSFQDTFIGRDSTWTLPPPDEGEGSELLYDGYIAFISPTGTRQWASYFGGWENDLPKSIVFDLNDNMVIGGIIESPSMIATTGTHQPVYSGDRDGFIIKFGEFLKIANISTPFCVGNPIDISYETGSEMGTGNVFTAELSDTTGDFSDPIEIGSESGTGDGVINATIPESITPGSGYRIRVKSSNPAKISPDNGYDITIYPLPEPEITGDSPVCSRYSLTYTAETDTTRENHWFIENGEIIGDSAMEYVVVVWDDVSEGTLKVVQRNIETGCIDSTDMTVSINITPVPDIIGETEVIAHSTESYRTVNVSYLSFYWEVTSGVINNNPENSEIEVSWGGTGTGTVKLVITHNTTGCSDSLVKNIAINSTPITINGKKTVCAHSQEIYSLIPDENIEYEWSVTGGEIEGDNTDTLIVINWGEPGNGIIKIAITNTQTQETDTVNKNITILELPDVGIIGINEVCEGETQIFAATNTSEVTSRWDVYNGSIIGDDDRDTVYVEWNEIEEGNDSLFVIASVILTQTDKNTGCSNSKLMRINLSAKPDAEIIGKTKVCENIIEYYSTTILNNNYLNEWFVTGGTIIGSSSDTVLQVQWDNIGFGSIKLIQTSSTNCVDSNIINVVINPHPPKPIITQIGKILQSSADNGNQWYSEGEPIEGEKSKLFEPKQSGYYSVMVTDSNGCESEMSDLYYFDIEGSVYDIRESSEFISIYPNPTNGIFDLLIKDIAQGKIEIIIRNTIGNIFYKANISVYDNMIIKQIDASEFPAGIYILNVKIKDDLFINKLIKY
jgi:hypothetical protein